MKDKTSNKPKLNLRNWECGVLVPTQRSTIPGERTTSGGPDNGGQLSISVFDGVVPVPVIMPG